MNTARALSRFRTGTSWLRSASSRRRTCCWTVNRQGLPQPCEGPVVECLDGTRAVAARSARTGWLAAQTHGELRPVYSPEESFISRATRRTGGPVSFRARGPLPTATSEAARPIWNSPAAPVYRHVEARSARPAIHCQLALVVAGLQVEAAVARRRLAISAGRRPVRLAVRRRRLAGLEQRVRDRPG